MNRPPRPVRATRSVRSRGVPEPAVRALTAAYVQIVRATCAAWFEAHEADLGVVQLAPVQDAAQKATRRLPTAVVRLVDQATRTVQASVDQDVQKVERILGAKAAGGAALLDAFRTRNMRLIKTASTETIDRLDAALKQWGNLHVKGLTSKLLEVADVSVSRAKFWAVDQTLKLHADITQAKHESLGITEYFWRTSRDGTVRATHAVLEGTRQKYSSPPDTGTGPHNPGKDYRCRCHADPILDTESLTSPKPEKVSQAKRTKQIVQKIKAQPQAQPKPIEAAPGGTLTPTEQTDLATWEKLVKSAENSPYKQQILYRAANTETLTGPTSFATELQTAKAYQNNPGFGGKTLYRTLVEYAEAEVLDIRGSQPDQVASIIRATGIADPGAVTADFLLAQEHVLDRLRARGINWVRLLDTYPEGAETWTWLYAGDEPPLFRVPSAQAQPKPKAQPKPQAQPKLTPKPTPLAGLDAELTKYTRDPTAATQARKQVRRVLDGTFAQALPKFENLDALIVAAPGDPLFGITRGVHAWDGTVTMASQALREALDGVRHARATGKFQSVQSEAGVRTLLHEELHGFTNCNPSTYWGVGRLLEEVGTELNARHATAKIAPVLAHAAGGYQDWIDIVGHLMATVLGIGKDAALERLRAAWAEQYTRPKVTYSEPEHVLDALLRALDVTGEQHDRLHRALIDIGNSVGTHG